MRYNNKRTKAQLVLGAEFSNITHLPSVDAVVSVLSFGGVAATTDIV